MALWSQDVWSPDGRQFSTMWRVGTFEELVTVADGLSLGDQPLSSIRRECELCDEQEIVPGRRQEVTSRNPGRHRVVTARVTGRSVRSLVRRALWETKHGKLRNAGRTAVDVRVVCCQSMAKIGKDRKPMSRRSSFPLDRGGTLRTLEEGVASPKEAK